MLLCAKHLFLAANGGKLPLPGGSMMSNGTASALNSAQDLASIPLAGASPALLSRASKTPAYQWYLSRRVGLTPEVIADPEDA